jgi:hypothetical protein
MNCKQCGNLLNQRKDQKVFCSKSCSASYNNKKRGPLATSHKEKIRNSLLLYRITHCKDIVKKKRVKKERVKRVIKKPPTKCVVCNADVPHIFGRRKKTCSESCLTALKRQINFNKILNGQKYGGLRRGSGRGKHGWYDNVFFDSTYELAYYIYCKSNNIKIARSTAVFNYINSDGYPRKYYPDFQLEDTLVEIKGFETPDVILKTQSVNVPIVVLYKEDLKEIFKFVETLTGVKIEKLYTLYEKRNPMEIRTPPDFLKESRA